MTDQQPDMQPPDDYGVAIADPADGTTAGRHSFGGGSELVQVGPGDLEIAATIAAQLVGTIPNLHTDQTAADQHLYAWSAAANYVYDWLEGRRTAMAEAGGQPT